MLLPWASGLRTCSRDRGFLWNSVSLAGKVAQGLAGLVRESASLG